MAVNSTPTLCMTRDKINNLTPGQVLITTDNKHGGKQAFRVLERGQRDVHVEVIPTLKMNIQETMGIKPREMRDSDNWYYNPKEINYLA